MIKIGKDKIFKFGNMWVVNLNLNEEEHRFLSKKAAINYYCRNCCNPIYNEIHYDCEGCPIKNED